MARQWTPEDRVRQSGLIHNWRPWGASSGPTTPEGKAKSSRNAYKGGAVGKALRLAQALKDLSEATARVEKLSKPRRNK